MPPRLSARRLCIVIVFLATVTIFVAVQDRLPWPPSSATRSAAQHRQQSPSANNNAADNNDNNDDDEGNNRNDGAMVSTVAVDSGRGTVADNDADRPRIVEKAWFFAGGTQLPTNFPKGKMPRLFPDDTDGDRIVDQLMYVPEDYQGYETPMKTIVAYNGLGAWGQRSGSASFYGCPVNRCLLTDDRSRAGDADALLYKDHFIHPGISRPTRQVWIMYFLECPYHTQSVKYSHLINWTATYRRDSDLVAPYERWTYYDTEVRQKVQVRDYSLNKTKKVAWFVSNCGARNGRLAYARELGKHISVDIYGTCGPLKCPRSDQKCFDILDQEYKFYLAFENSNCRDYITEKFYVNGLSQNVIPIVMGGRPEDYQRSAPEGSYIHVDEFASPAELAEYLHRLDKDDALYNSYFKWKGTGEFINTYFWCRLCAMLHAPSVYRHYDDVNEWWRGPGVCTPKSWRTAEAIEE